MIKKLLFSYCNVFDILTVHIILTISKLGRIFNMAHWKIKANKDLKLLTIWLIELSISNNYFSDSFNKFCHQVNFDVKKGKLWSSIRLRLNVDLSLSIWDGIWQVKNVSAIHTFSCHFRLIIIEQIANVREFILQGISQNHHTVQKLQT